MANVFTEGWEGGANGVTCTKSNTAFNSFVDPLLKFSSLHVPTGQGAMSARFICSATNAIAQTTFSARSASYQTIFLYNEGAYPTSNASLANNRGGGNTVVRSELRVTTTGALQLRNSGFVQVAVSAAGMVPLTGLCRIEWMYNNATGQQRALLYKTNPLGPTPDWDSGLIATTAAGTVDAVTVGLINVATWTATLGDYNVDDAAFPSYTGAPTGGSVGYRASANPVIITSGTTISIVMPAGSQVGDVALLSITGGVGGITNTPPAGWAPLTSQNGAALSFNLWGKTLVLADLGSTVTITSNNTAGYKREVDLTVFSTAQIGGVASAMPPPGAPTAAHLTPQVTAVDPNAWMAVGCSDKGSPSSASWSLAAGLTLRKQLIGSGGGSVSSVVATDDVVGAGSVGSYLITGTLVTDQAAMWSVVLEPLTATLGGIVDAGPDMTTEPWVPVSVTAIPSKPVTSWLWEQLTPVTPTLTLTGATTATVGLTTPGAITPITYKIRVTANFTGGGSATDDFNLTVLPATKWFIPAVGPPVPIQPLKVT